MVEADIESVAAIHEKAWKEAFRGILSDQLLDGFGGSGLIDSWRRTIQREDRRNVVAEIESDKTIVGFCGFERSADSKGRGELIVMHVDPTRRRTGIGTHLLNHSAEKMHQSGIEKVYLWKVADNWRALTPIDMWYYDTVIDMSAVTVSAKYQIVISKDLRDRLALRPGDKLEVFEIDGRIEIVPRRTLKSLRGFLPGLNTSIERDDDRR